MTEKSIWNWQEWRLRDAVNRPSADLLMNLIRIVELKNHDAGKTLLSRKIQVALAGASRGSQLRSHRNLHSHLNRVRQKSHPPQVSLRQRPKRRPLSAVQGRNLQPARNGGE
jgi:hypothetical protein